MSGAETSQRRALRKYRSNLARRGLARFEVLALEADRDLIRALAMRLAKAGPDADLIRDAVSRTMADPAPATGGIYAALRRSPLVGAELDLTRPQVPERPVQL